MVNLDKIMTKKGENNATVSAAPKGQITSVCYLDAKPELETAVSALKVFAEKHSRFASVPVASASCYYSNFQQCNVEAMDWDYHVQEETVGSREELEARLQEIMNKDLDSTKPLWQATVLSVAGKKGRGDATPRKSAAAAAAASSPSWFGWMSGSAPSSGEQGREEEREGGSTLMGPELSARQVTVPATTSIDCTSRAMRPSSSSTMPPTLTVVVRDM
mgnify:CR=1 FL=1